MDAVIEREKEVLESFKLYKKSNIKKLYFGQGIAQSINKTKLGYLPLGWDALKLTDLTTLITKGTTPSSLGRSFEDKGINFIKIESITADSNYIKDKFEHIDEVTHEKLKRSQLQTDDILFSIAGALGRVAIVTSELCPANVNQALAIIRLKKGINAKFIIEYLRSEAVSLYIEKVHVKGAQPNLSLKDINELYVPIPPIVDQDRISIEVGNLIKILKTIVSKLSASQSLQKSLINQIF